MKYVRMHALLFLAFLFVQINPSLSHADVIAILPDRSTAYPNGLHNGLLSSAYRNGISLELIDFGNFDGKRSQKILQEAIDSEDQPLIYCIWPVDDDSRGLIRELVNTHDVPVIQLNQLPSDSEWEYLLGYAGPDDALRAENAGIMMIDELIGKRSISEPKIVAFGYAESYAGYTLSINAFQNAIADTPLVITHTIPLEFDGQDQRAYNAMVELLDELDTKGEKLHGVYAMDDFILIGVYEALNDRGRLDGENAVTLVGTVCNGHRELLATGKEYGTTIQSPFLEAALAVDSVMEYLTNGNLTKNLRFTPNPIATTDTWETQRVDFLDEIYVADALCTWTIKHERTTWFQNTTNAKDVCDYIECDYISQSLFSTGYAIVAFNYALCATGFVLLFIFRNKRVVALAQPVFLGLVLLGAVVDTTSIIFMSRDDSKYSQEQLDRSCQTWVWLLTLGQMMTTTTLVAKMARVKAVIGIGGTSIRRTKVRVRDVIGFIVGGLLFDIIILSVWTATDPFQWIMKPNDSATDNITKARGVCASEGENFWSYPFVIVAVHFAVLVYGNILAWQTRRYHNISDSRMVAVSLFNSIQLLVVATIMLSLSGDNLEISYVIRACYAFLNNVGVILLVVAPKLYKCLIGKGDVMPNLHKHTTSQKNQKSGENIPGGRTHITGLNENPVISEKSSTPFTFEEDKAIQDSSSSMKALTNGTKEDVHDTRDTIEPEGPLVPGFVKKAEKTVQWGSSSQSSP